MVSVPEAMTVLTLTTFSNTGCILQGKTSLMLRYGGSVILGIALKFAMTEQNARDRFASLLIVSKN